MPLTFIRASSRALASQISSADLGLGWAAQQKPLYFLLFEQKWCFVIFARRKSKLFHAQKQQSPSLS